MAEMDLSSTVQPSNAETAGVWTFAVGNTWLRRAEWELDQLPRDGLHGDGENAPFDISNTRSLLQSVSPNLL